MDETRHRSGTHGLTRSRRSIDETSSNSIDRALGIDGGLRAHRALKVHISPAHPAVGSELVRIDRLVRTFFQTAGLALASKPALK
jgi:hypothetical protein